jgi:putative transposase
MAEAGSTTSEKVFKPYWNEQYAAIASSLWLPTETALHGLDGKSSIWLSVKAAVKSWFSIKTWEAPKTNSPRTSSTSFMSSPAACTDDENTVRLVIASKIRIYPNTQQQSLLRRWFGVSRKTYNATVEYLRTPETKAKFYDIKKWLIPSQPLEIASVN